MVRPPHASLVTLALVVGCASSVQPLDAGGDVGRDAGPPEAHGLDLLFVLDTGSENHDGPQAFAETFPRMLEVMTRGDLGLDGTIDFAPITSLHVGFVTTDLGMGPHEGVPSCRSGLADDARLRTVSRGFSECPESHPSGTFALGTDRDTLAHDLWCVASVGGYGCSFQQPLEAALKALSPSVPMPWTRTDYVPPRFLDAEGIIDAEAGHGDGANAGFLRPDSALAIVVLTYRDDCSVNDSGLFVHDDPRFSDTPLRLRCIDRAEGIARPVERYVDGFLGLRRDPRHVVFTAITGVPEPRLPDEGETPDFEAIEESPEMAYVYNMQGTNVVDLCATAERHAYPAPRIVAVGRAISEAGGHVSLASYCFDMEPAMDGLLAQIARVFPRR